MLVIPLPGALVAAQDSPFAGPTSSARLDQQAPLGSAGQHDRAAVTALEDGGTAVEQQTAALFLAPGGVAREAALGQQGAHLRLEKRGVLGGSGAAGRPLAACTADQQASQLTSSIVVRIGPPGRRLPKSRFLDPQNSY